MVKEKRAAGRGKVCWIACLRCPLSVAQSNRTGMPGVIDKSVSKGKIVQAAITLLFGKRELL